MSLSDRLKELDALIKYCLTLFILETICCLRMLSKNNTITSKDRHESFSVIENIEVY